MSLFGDAPAELLYSMPNVGQAVTGTLTTGTAAGGPLLGGGAAGVASLIPPCEIPHNYFAKIGKALLVDMTGVYGVGSTIPTLKFQVCIDNVPGTVVTTVCNTGAFTSTDITSARTAMGWNARVYITATAIGVSGTLQAWGWLNWGMLGSTLTTTVAAPQITYYMGAGTTTPVTFNTAQSAPTYLEPYAFWSTATAGCTITMTQMFCWGLN